MSKHEEKLLSKTNDDIGEMPQQNIYSLIQSLQLHQIELKIQNEELICAQQELQKSRDMYFQLYNFAPAGYLTINSDGIIIDCNFTASTLLNTKRIEIIKKKIVDLINQEDHEAYFLHAQNIMSGIPVEACLLKMYKGNGEFIYARMESNSVQDNHGNTNQCSVFIDVTECIIGERKLNKTVLELTKSNIELERFAYIASHDLREPLRNISSCTQLLDVKYGHLLDSEGLELMRCTIESVRQMNALISDLLSYSQPGKNSLRFERVDFNYILSHVLENLKQLILETQTKITFDKLPELTADNTQIAQLFQNLISNAIKHHNGNSIEIHIGLQQIDNSWLFAVRDNGPGIDSKYLEKIFDIFTRLNTNNKYQGTGIGLAICKQVIDNHGGKIWAESIVGNGSTFYFTLDGNN